MSGKTLDRTRKFGVVVGASDGSLYYQDGCCFNGDGQLVGADAPAPAAEASSQAQADETPESGAAVTREQLEPLHPAKIKKLVELAGLELETGQGSKARNIENLLAAG